MSDHVAIVIPTYNSARTLRQCLVSIQAQTVRPYEVVVVDDELTTDKTREIANEFAAHLIVSPSKRAASRNEGFERTASPLLLSIDSDMVLAPNLIEELLIGFSSGAAALSIREVGIGSGYWCRGRVIDKESVDATGFGVAIRAIRRELFMKVGGYDDGLTAGEDLDLHQRVVAERARILHISRTHIQHDEHGLTLRAAVSKKFMYGLTMPAFEAKHGGQITQGWSKRLASGVSIGLRRDPTAIPSFLILKLAEGGAGVIGDLVGRTRSFTKSAETPHPSRPNIARRVGERGARIAFLDSMPIGFGGGYESFVMDAAVEATNRAHEVCVIEPSPLLVRIFRSPLGTAAKGRLTKAQVQHRLGGLRPLRAGPWSVARTLKEMDVVYLKNEPQEIAFIWLLRRLGVRRARFVVGIHSVPLGRPGLSGRFRASIYRSFIYGRWLTYVDKFHVLQPAHRDFLINRFDIAPKSIEVIPNGVDLSRFSNRGLPLQHPVRLLFVGRLDLQKGVDTLLEAFEYLQKRERDRVSLTVAGDGPLSGLVERVAAGEPGLNFLGFEEDAPSLYRSHDLLVAPSRWEAFALVPAEALASGLPGVLSDIDANSPYSQCHSISLVPPDHSVLLARAIARRVDEWSKFASSFDRDRQEARAFAERNLDQKYTLNRLLKLLENVSIPT